MKVRVSMTCFRLRILSPGKKKKKQNVNADGNTIISYVTLHMIPKFEMTIFKAK